MSRVGDETIRNVNLGATSSDPLLGQVIDNYKVESLIGTGAMGIVYRGVHQVIGKAAAIKVLKADFSDDDEMVQRLIREARSVNAIRHPAIVDIFGFGTLQRTGQPYIVMDLLEGDPLDEYLKANGPMKLKQVGPLLDELLSALSAAHAVGVIHRDLKPGNVFIEKKHDGQRGLKVIDFGLAKQADRAGGSVKPTNPGTLLGTPAFMAPEQVLGTKVTPATDLYAVGGIAYQMLTNHLPHEAPTAIEVLSQKMSHDPIRPRQWQPSLDEELDAWVMNLLSREPGARYQAADEARRVLRRITDGRTSASSGNRPAHPKGTSGVVPKREWAESKTLITEGADGAKSAEVSTDQGRVSPWAQTNIEHQAQPDPDLTPPPPRQRSPSGRHLEAATVTVNPEEVAAAQARAAGPGDITAPEIERPGEDTALNPGQDNDVVLPPPSRTGLYIALLCAVIALLGGLVWLVGQR